MERNDFIQQFVASFLAANAAARYNNNVSGRWDWVYDQPINDAMYVAEQAWASIEKSARKSSTATAGNAVTVQAGTESTLTTSSKPDGADPTPSTTSSPSAGNATGLTTTDI